MTTKVVRISDIAADEAAAASRVLGVSPAELLTHAWMQYRESAEFRQAFESAQQAIASGDLTTLTKQMQASARTRATERATRAARPID